jgi:hypothetical protein
MESKEFIEKELRNFIEKFPQSRVRYEFRELANAYFIEVLPREVYSSNAAYTAWESEMWDKFVALYPEEGICFTSEGMLVEIKNPELTLCGKFFTPAPTAKAIAEKRKHTTTLSECLTAYV